MKFFTFKYTYTLKISLDNDNHDFFQSRRIDYQHIHTSRHVADGGWCVQPILYCNHPSLPRGAVLTPEK